MYYKEYFKNNTLTFYNLGLKKEQTVKCLKDIGRSGLVRRNKVTEENRRR